MHHTATVDVTITAAPNFERKGFHCLYSFFSPIVPYASPPLHARTGISTEIFFSPYTVLPGAKFSVQSTSSFVEWAIYTPLNLFRESQRPIPTYDSPRRPSFLLSFLHEHLRDLHGHRDHHVHHDLLRDHRGLRLSFLHDRLHDLLHGHHGHQRSLRVHEIHHLHSISNSEFQG